MAGDTKEIGAPFIDDGIDPLQPLTRALKEGYKALLDWHAMVGTEIIRLDAAAAPVIQSQHVKFRMRGVIVNGITAGTMTLTIGTGTYPFEAAARALAYVPFPLVIERGADMSCAGVDGRIYLIGDPE